jgi:hypothetical protein
MVVLYYALRALSWTGLVWDVREPPRHIRDGHRVAAPTAAPTAVVPAPALGE